MEALKKVLVVDDDPVIGMSFDRVLSPRGYAVITAKDGAEALDRLAREAYDMVYTDIKMPGMDGLEVAARIKASNPWLPVMIVTGYGSDANEAQAKEIGVSAFLRKPVSPEMIETSASHALFTLAPAGAVAATLESAAAAVAVPAAVAEVAVPAAVAEVAPKIGRFALNVGLFLAAPFIGLAYILAFPFIGLGMLGWEGYKALTGKAKRG